MSTILKTLVVAVTLAAGIAVAEAHTITPHGVWDQIDMQNHDARGK